MMNKNKLNSSISLDLDNQWAYMKIHGDSGWEKYPTYLDTFVPYILESLDELKLNITFFIVGKDADDERNFEVLKQIPNHGHEIANHSYNHESWFHLYSKEKILEELESTERSLEKITDQKINGFRGPGFSWSHDLLEILKSKNYLYDASTFPTYIGPLARFYYFQTANLSKEEKEERSGLFGSFTDGFKKNKSYKWNLIKGQKLLEIPVTTIPVVKVPFHMSYLMYLARFSMPLMTSYLQFAISMCKLTKTEPSFLLHPLDLIGGDKIPALSFFPGMDLKSDMKKEIFYVVINKLSENFNLLNMTKHAEILNNKK